MGLSLDTIVQITLAITLGVLSLVGSVASWIFVQVARALMKRLNQFEEFIGAAREHRVKVEERLESHGEKLTHHQRWLEEHEKRLARDAGCLWREPSDEK